MRLIGLSFERHLHMFPRLKRHPFGVEAFFRRSLVLTYAMPGSVLADLVGPGLALDTYDDWGCVGIQTLVIATMNTLKLRNARDLLLSPIAMVCANAILLGLGWYLALAS